MNRTSLSTEQAEAFLRDGYVVIPGCLSRETCGEWTRWAFERLGYDPHDSSTWQKPRIHMGPERMADVAAFSPKGWEATCAVVGGADRVKTPYIWADTFVVNLSEGADRPFEDPSPSSPGWHKDGYFFRHFLDSPEQGLLTVVAWTDVLSHGGATFVAVDSVGVVARFLADNPEGVEPDVFGALIDQCQDFRELIVEVGDVVLIHPYMLHASSQNVRRLPRIISNPPLFLREPMQFDLPDPADYSLVELGVLRALGRERLKFSPTRDRRSDYPEWILNAQKRLSGSGEVSCRG